MTLEITSVSSHLAIISVPFPQLPISQIVFDECHRAKNLCPVGSAKPTKTGLTVLELQKQLPKARIVYASATGASEPKNMAYMVRLGIWGEGTPFNEFNDFISAVEKRYGGDFLQGIGGRYERELCASLVK